MGDIFLKKLSSPHEWWAPFHPPIKQGKLERLRIYASPKTRAKRRSGSGVVCDFLRGAPEFFYTRGAGGPEIANQTFVN